MAEKNALLDVAEVENLLNGCVEFIKRFFQEEEGNRLTHWAAGGFLNQYTGFIQDSFNKLKIYNPEGQEVQENVVDQPKPKETKTKKPE